MKKLFIGNVSFSTSESALNDAFKKYVSIVSCKLITDRETGQSRGFAFIEMQDASEADRAISEMNGYNLGGKMLKVNEAKPQTDRSSGSARGGFNRSRY